MNDNTAGILLFVAFLLFVGFVCLVAWRKET
jgi:hypothetical protein